MLKLKGASKLVYFDMSVLARVIVDTSPVGFGSVLSKEVEGKSRDVCYASSSLKLIVDTVKQ